MRTMGQVAIVHDYLTQRGGAERVVLAMVAAFPGAPVYTSVYEPSGTFPEFAAVDVRPLWTNRIGWLRHDHRRGLPIYPMAFGSCRADADVVICSSSGFAHGVRTAGRKIVYCHTPARWLYDEAQTYLTNWPAIVRIAARTVRAPMRAWDRRAAGTADAVLTNSGAVRNRIAELYGLEATVAPPPAGLSASGPRRRVEGVEPGFVLTVGRLLAYKNVDAVVRAMAELPTVRLVVAGTGPEQARLEAASGPNVTLVGAVDEAELRWLYDNCAGLVSASFEDFGLTPVEAALHGRPAAVLRRGGFLDTVIEGTTGVFFDEPSALAAAQAITEMIATTWCHKTLTSHGAQYSQEAFTRALTEAAACST